MYRYSGLCYIINGYEVVHEIEKKDPECEYILVTDDPNLRSKTWDVVYDKDLRGRPAFEACYDVRFHPFRYVSTDVCVYVDAAIGMKSSLRPLIDVFNQGKYDFCLMPHPYRNILPDEIMAWVKYRGYDINAANRFIKLLRDSNYDMSYRGMFQGCFRIERRCKKSRDMEDLTWSFLRYLSPEGDFERIDQTVMSYVMNYYFSDSNVLAVSEQILHSDFMQWYKHGSNEPNTNAPYDEKQTDYRFMFNRPVVCYYLMFSKK